MKFYALDFETANNFRTSVCQIGLLKYEDDSITEIINAFVNPNTDFLPANTRVHGIDKHKIDGCPDFFYYVNDLVRHLEGEFVVSHSDFDNQVLKQTFENLNLNPLSYRKIDTLRVAKDVWPDLENHRLDTVCNYLGIDMCAHHHAYHDAISCAKVLIEAINRSGNELDYFANLSSPRDTIKKPYYKNSGNLKRNRKIENNFINFSVCFTGDVNCFDSKQTAADFAAENGFDVESSITKKVTHVVYGQDSKDNQSLKYKEAVNRNLIMMTGLEFSDYVNNNIAKAP